MQAPRQTRWLTVREAADRMGVSPKTVYKMFHAREIFGVKIRFAVRIDGESVAAYLASHSNEPARGECPGPVISDKPTPLSSRTAKRGALPLRYPRKS